MSGGRFGVSGEREPRGIASSGSDPPVSGTGWCNAEHQDLPLVCVDLSDDATAKFLEFLDYQTMARCL
jgi:hypothetical protein